MDHFLTTTVDDITDDPDLLHDVMDSSLWDIPSHVEASRDFNDFLDLLHGDSVTADIHNDTAEYSELQQASDNSIPLSAARLTFDSRGASVTNGLRRNMSKNAILARENREKKKQYIRGLEKTVRDISVKNKKLEHGCTAMRKTIASLHQEVNYLRGVIENQSELARLLKHIPVADPTRQLQVNTNHSLLSDKSEEKNTLVCINQAASASSLNSSDLKHAESMPTADCQSLLTEHDYARSERQNKRNNSSRQHFGVCLHVANQVTSLQLCAHCNENAQ